jgi:hypothetical protein
MRCTFALFFAVCLFCGCRNQSPPGDDPFFGRTTVPAPPTGSAVVLPAGAAPRATPSAAGPTVTVPPPQANASAAASPSRSTQVTASPVAQGSPSVIRIVEPSGRASAAGEAPNTFSPAGAKALSGESAPPARNDVSPSASAGADAALNGRASVVRTISARPKTDASNGGVQSSNSTAISRPDARSSTLPSRPIDIMDLPKADSSAPSTSLFPR